MAWHVRVLVIANVTATSPDLLAALKERADRGPIDPTLLMPATRNGFAGREEAQGRLDEALARWREAGFEAKGMVGDPTPPSRCTRRGTRARYDEVIVSTLPGRARRWLQSDLPHRVAQITGLHVTHVVVARRARSRARGPPPEREKPALGPLHAARAALALTHAASARRVGARPSSRTRVLVRRRATGRRSAPRRSPPGAASRRAPAAARRAARRRCARRARPGRSGSGPQSTTRPPTTQNASGARGRSGAARARAATPAWIARITPPSRPSSVRSRAWRRRSHAARS